MKPIVGNGHDPVERRAKLMAAKLPLTRKLFWLEHTSWLVNVRASFDAKLLTLGLSA